MTIERAQLTYQHRNGNYYDVCDAFCPCGSNRYCTVSFNCGCSNDSGCPAGQKCRTDGSPLISRCFACTADKDCKTGEFCISASKCVKPAPGSVCTDDYQCPSGYLCSLGSKTCVAPGHDDAACGRPTECISGNCCSPGGMWTSNRCGCCPGFVVNGYLQPNVCVVGKSY